MDGLIRAGGGVVWRPATGKAGAPGGVEVLLVHRPRYDDWTFPKGKCEPGEPDELCALREVEEETGMRCTLGHELVSTRYVDGRGRDKLVRYWTMTVAEENVRAPDDEVDVLQWLDPAVAAERLTYARDQPVAVAFRRWAAST